MRARSLVLLATLALALGACGSTTTSPSPAPSASTGAAITPVPSIAATPSLVPTPAPMSLKVMDFNIEYGGQQVDFAKIVEAVQAADPDAVAIEEAEGHTRELAEKAGYPYANVRNQVISKFPIIDPPGADGKYVYIEVAPGAVVALSNVHLPSDPYGPYLVRDGGAVEDVIKLEQDTRMPAIQSRLDVLPALVAQGIPTFLTGDFNAPSHLDWTSATVGKLPQIKYPVDWPVSKAVEAAGFTDAYRALHPDPLADPGLTWWAGRPIVDDYPDHKDPQDRIDILYAAGNATPTDIKIVGEAGGPQVDISVDPWGTDHRGVVGTFTVSPAVPGPTIAVDERLVTLGEPVRVRFLGFGDGEVTVRLEQLRPNGVVSRLPDAATVLGPDGETEIPTGPTTLGLGDYQLEAAVGGEVVSMTPFTVAAPDAPPTLTIDPAAHKTGEPIGVSWRNVPGSRWDWLGVYKRGADPLVDSYLYYQYTDQSVAGSGLIDEHGSAGDLTWPLPPGEYDVHYLLDDGYVSLAKAPLTVTE
jgi:endonuclease/exonuclease/phosphatase family metal-dependent hydrolase